MAPQDVPAQVLSDWVKFCIISLPNTTTLAPGLVDQYGHATVRYNSSWGITYDTCEQYCNSSIIPLAKTFDFQDFAQAFTNYLLPWLALTAQLPYETGSPWQNIMSFCMAVGSPALATYSLTVTILNRYWIRKKFKKIEDGHKAGVKARGSNYHVRLDSMCYFLSEAQQVPLRASQEGGWLSSLIVEDANHDWWQDVSQRLKETRRGVTFSLVAQVLSAVLAWIFVVVSAFQASLGKPVAALQMSVGSLWIWMVPVICGWIIVGTQYAHGTVHSALENKKAYRAQPDNRTKPSKDVQKGIRTGSDRLARLEDIDTGRFILDNSCNNVTSFWTSGVVIGDEGREGPIYNYARMFTWYQFAHTITTAVKMTMKKIDKDISVQQIDERTTDDANSHPMQRIDERTTDASNGHPVQRIDERTTDASNGHPVQRIDERTADDANSYPMQRIGERTTDASNDKFRLNNMHALQDLAGNSRELAKYCGLQQQPYGTPPAYASFTSMLQTGPDNHVSNTMICSAGVAIFVQWGTTGAAMIIAYLTPVRGLDCRSGSYLLYGIASTVGWLCLVASMMLSHKVMLWYQDHQDQKRPDILCGLAVMTRLVGKLIIMCNAAWMVISSLLEIIGVYDNCWCNANYLSAGRSGWVLLFKTSADLKEVASGIWAGGITLSILVSSITIMIFWLGRYKG